MRVTGCDVMRIAGGRVEESSFNLDMLALLQQLGVIPMPESAGR